MSQKDLETAIDRLLQARETINWARAALNDPASHLGDYNLTPDEKGTLLQVMHAHLTEIHTTGAIPIPAIPIPPFDQNGIGMAPPIPPIDSGNEEVAPPMRGAIPIPPVKPGNAKVAPPIPPWPDQDDT